NAWEWLPADVHLAPGNPVPVPTYCYHGLWFTLYQASLAALNRPICIGGSASPKGRPSNFCGVRFRTDNFRPALVTRRVVGRSICCRLIATTAHCGRASGGMPLVAPMADSLHYFVPRDPRAFAP